MKLRLSKIFPRIFNKKSDDSADIAAISQISLCESQNNRVNISTTRLELIDCRTVRIFLLDKSEIEITVKNSIKAFLLIQNICLHQNIFDNQYFGLKYKDGIHWKWIEEYKSLRSQLPGLGLLTFYFGVKFFPTDPSLLTDEFSKLQIFNQLKSDLISHKFPFLKLTLRFQLYSLMLQSEFGDFDTNKHKSGYFCDFLHEDLKYEQELVTLHRKLRGKRPSDVENEFLDRIKWLEFYGINFTPATYGSESSRCMLGIGPEGIVIYKSKIKIHTHFWTSISKISFSSDHIKLRSKERPGSSTNTYIYSGLGIAETEILYKDMLAHYNFRTLSLKNPLVSSLRQQNSSVKNLYRKSGSKSCAEDIQIRPVSHSYADSMKELNHFDHIGNNEYRKRGYTGGYASEPDRFTQYSQIKDQDNEIYVKRHKHTCQKHLASSYQDMNTEYNEYGSRSSINDRRVKHQHRNKRHQCNSMKFPPRELAQHFRYIDPIDEGLDLDEIKNIPYTVVRTKNPDIRKLDRSPSKRSHRNNRRSTLDWAAPDGEAPPPYLSPPKQNVEEADQMTLYGSTRVLSAIPVNTLHIHQAPIVKTKSVMMQPNCFPSITKSSHFQNDMTLKSNDAKNQYFSTVVLTSKNQKDILDQTENFEIKTIENNILCSNNLCLNEIENEENLIMPISISNSNNFNKSNINVINNNIKHKGKKVHRDIISDSEGYTGLRHNYNICKSSAYSDMEYANMSNSRHSAYIQCENDVKSSIGFKQKSDLRYIDSIEDSSLAESNITKFIDGDMDFLGNKKGNSPPILLSSEKKKNHKDDLSSKHLKKKSHWLITQI